MADRLILLTTPEFADLAVAPLRAARSGLAIRPAFTLPDLRDALVRDGSRVRLLGFASGVIVPADLLDAATAGAYNLHCGPPTFPGLFPSVFAIYEGARRFGATLHEMSATVDDGAIVATSWFDLPGDADRLTADTLALKAMLDLLAARAPALTDLTRRPSPNGERWSGPVRRTRDFAALCRLPPDVSAEEFARRYRAVGEGPEHALEITVHGQRFVLDNRRADTVVRANACVRSPRVA
ncbi:MAG: formyltransferase family protein [Rhodospirillaceae bacterium]|nr:formyltransferase family protein [Rhodospirillaceae bacterium]